MSSIRITNVVTKGKELWAYYDIYEPALYPPLDFRWSVSEKLVLAPLTPTDSNVDHHVFASKEEYDYVAGRLKTLLYSWIGYPNTLFIINHYETVYEQKEKKEMEKRRFAQYRQKAMDKKIDILAFRSLSMDGENKGKLIVNYYKFYASGKVEKIRLDGVDNPFDPERHAVELKNENLKDISPCIGLGHFLNMCTTKETVETRIPPEPEVIEVTMADLEKMYGKKVKIVKEKK